MSATEHRRDATLQLGRQLSYYVITVSDTRTPKTDKSGPLIRQLAEDAGQRVAGGALVSDEQGAIRGAVQSALEDRDVDVIVLTGGTGFAPRDVTADAVAPLFEQSVDGFGELFRMLSYEQVGAAAMLSRACAGIAARKLIFVLPGSSKAVALAMEKLILPEAGHLLSHVRR